MTKITQIEDRGATIAWSPIRSHPDLVALGAKDSGAVAFEDTGGELELFDLNITSSHSQGSPTPQMLGSVKTKSRFASVSWSPGGGSVAHRFKLGLLAGGMVDGTVHIWDANAILQQKKESSLLSTITKHGSGPVKAMQFSPLKPTRLATGGSNGQVWIIDLEEQPENPVVRAPSEEYKQYTEITALSWNTQVEHIVASAAGDGSVAVLDLNSGKAWCELRCETSGQAVADVCWNPTQGLHLLTASLDDRNPLLKIWDLRASTSMPLATLSGHTQGILKTSWCPHDDTLLLSVGKDNRTILWDLYTLRPIADVPNDAPENPSGASASNGGHHMGGTTSDLFGPSGLASSQQRRYHVEWSPVNRGVAATCSLDRKVQVHSVISLATRCGRPPKWMKPSCSVSCGFGGSVVSCGAADKVIRFQTIVEQKGLVEASLNFENSIASTTVVELCQQMAAKSKDTHEAQTWGFMKVIFETNARQQLLQHLGFDADRIAAAAMAYTDKDPTNGMASMSLQDQQCGMSKAAENVVKEALLVGNFEAAVECCFRTGNLADALILASCGGSDLWSKTQERFFSSQSSKRPFLSIVSAIIRNQMEELVAHSETSRWQETLAILSTYGQSEEFPKLCIALGDRLESVGDFQNASLCYMCSLSLQHSVKFWRSKMEEATRKKGTLDIMALHEFVVKVSVFLKASGGTPEALEPDIAELFSKYAQALAEQGLFVTASNYCRGSSDESKILKDRLYRSRASQRCLQVMGGVAPEFPFSLQNDRSSRSAGTTTFPRTDSTQQPQTTSQSQLQTTSVPLKQSSTHSESQLPGGWMALQDPSSGRTYYANQTTGETTWEMPQAEPATTQQISSQPGSYYHTAANSTSQQQESQSAAYTSSTNSKLASTYGDGFVTSQSHPELADKYGNNSTSNPYTGVARPGTARISSQQKAPVSDTINFDTLELPQEYHPIRDGLLGIHTSLSSCPLTVADKRQLEEGRKGVAILLKRLTRGDVNSEVAYKVASLTNALLSRDYATMASIQNDLVNNEWKNNKDWLKGVKMLNQLASKRL